MLIQFIFRSRAVGPLCTLHITAHVMNNLSSQSLKVKQIIITRCTWGHEKYFDLLLEYSIWTFKLFSAVTIIVKILMVSQFD